MADFLTNITAISAAVSGVAMSGSATGAGSTGVVGNSTHSAGTGVLANANGGGIGLSANTASTINPAANLSNTNSSAGPALIVKTSNTTNNGGVIIVQDSTPTTQLTIKQSGAILYATAAFPSSPATGDNYYHNTYRSWFVYTGATDGWQQTAVGTFVNSFPTVAGGESAKKIKVFRSDRGIEYYYDGTRWLSSTLFEITMPFYIEEDAGLPKSPISVTQPSLHYVVRPDSSVRDIFLVEVAVYSFIISGTFDTTNKWTVELQRVPSTGAFVTVGSVRDLFLDDDGSTTRSAGTRYVSTVDLGGTQLTKANAVALLLKWTKVNTPASLYSLSAVLKYRKVG